jgi:hypothetical protein
MANLQCIARFGVLLAALVLAFGALAPGSALAKAGGSDLPLKGSLSGTSVHDYATGHLEAVSTGNLTHLGLTTLAQDAQIVIVPGTPPTLSWTGTWTLTAANGDQLWGTAVGIGTPTDATHIRLVLDYTLTGGTGRFQHASATFTAVVYHHQVSLVNAVSYGEHEATLDGQLSW